MTNPLLREAYKQYSFNVIPKIGGLVANPDPNPNPNPNPNRYPYPYPNPNPNPNPSQVANDAASYQYLVESIQKFPDQESFAALVCEAGFRHVSHTSLTGGVVAIHSGIKS